MNSVDIEKVLITHLRENYLPQGSEIRIALHEDLFDSGVLDSAALLSVIAFIETEFSISIPDADLLPVHFSSIASTATYLRERIVSPTDVASVGSSYDALD